MTGRYAAPVVFSFDPDVSLKGATFVAEVYLLRRWVARGDFVAVAESSRDCLVGVFLREAVDCMVGLVLG